MLCYGISELKILQTGNPGITYFDFKFQGKEETRCVICFSKDKWEALKVLPL